MAKKTKQETVIESLKHIYSSDKSLVLSNSTKELLIVLGNTRSGHNRLIKHTYADNYNKVLKSSTEVSFDEMCEENAVEIDVEEDEIVK